MRQRKRKDNITDGDAAVVVVILIAGTIYTYQQDQWSLFWLCILLLSVLLLGVAITLLVRHHKNERLRRSGIDQVDKMSGIEFEKYIKQLLIMKGYTNVQLTESYDLGIDIIASKDGEVWGIQTKRYKSTVGLEAVRQAAAAMKYYKCTKIAVITNSYFTRHAQTIAKSIDCTLIDRPVLINLMLETHPHTGQEPYYRGRYYK